MLLGSMLSFQACKNNDNDVAIIESGAFVNQAASGNMLEIQAGAMAQQRGQSTAVKAYGEHMVTDHTTASNELKAMAQSKGITVPTQLMEAHQQMLSTLTPLTGDAFDKAFTKLMVDSHNEQVSLFERASVSVNDADFRTLAKNKLPTLREHLQEAVALNATINQ